MSIVVVGFVVVIEFAELVLLLLLLLLLFWPLSLVHTRLGCGLGMGLVTVGANDATDFAAAAGGKRRCRDGDPPTAASYVFLR